MKLNRPSNDDVSSESFAGKTPLPALGCFSFLWPALQGFNLPIAVQARIEQAAAQFADVPRIALELRLGEADGPVDLHQMFLREAGELAILSAHLDMAPAEDVPARGLHAFIERWQRYAVSHPWLDRLFLEWDATMDGFSSPAVFFPAQPKPGTRGEMSTWAESLLPTLFDGAHFPGGNAIPQFVQAAAADGISISHIGVMLSRRASPVPALRINFRGVKHGSLGVLLDALGWQGQRAQALTEFDRLVEMADTVTVAFNLIGGAITSDIGFEVMYDHEPAWEPRWSSLLLQLHERGLCTKAKMDCLMHFPAKIAPTQRTYAWPAAWMVAAELAEDERIPQVDRDLSHIKLSLNGHGGMHAKAYVSVQHTWRGPGVGVSAQSRLNPSATLDAAEAAAIAFLLRSRRQSGWWTEFRTERGPSDEWTTAFVAWALLSTHNPHAHAAARDALNLLLPRQREGGWGFNRVSGPDADTTAWVLRLFAELPSPDDAHDQAMRFLKTHLLSTGGVATYRDSIATGARGGVPVARADGWIASHLCVAANAVLFLPKTALDQFVENQSEDGSWAPYWWRTPALATALAVEALASEPYYNHAAQKAILWARRFPVASASNFVQIWIARILCHGNEQDHALARAMLEHLIAAQREDGSWAPSADLRMPDKNDLGGDTAAEIDYEVAGIFTTASAIGALTSLRAHSGRPPMDVHHA